MKGIDETEIIVGLSIHLNKSIILLLGFREFPCGENLINRGEKMFLTYGVGDLGEGYRYKDGILD